MRELRKRQRLDFEVWGEVRDPRDPYFGWRAQILVEERRRRKWRMAKALCGVKNGREECGVAVCRCCGKGVEGGLNALQRVGLPLLDGEESEGLSDEEVLRRTREGEASLEVRRWMLESVIG